ncbi:30S ribosomal protein S5 [Candidatus Woesearchaeota archaeon]|nr:30S ribosomal protein S5 [Candidatus Woesearchaeota archaeon]
MITELPEEEELKKEKRIDLTGWQPKTSIGKKVKQGEIKHIRNILDQATPIMEVEIVDALLPNLKNELLFIGQSKGKFGGGQKRVFRQTQKKTPEGNKPSFSCQAVVGNEDGYVGIGYGKSKDTVPSREKSLRKAKLNIFQIKRGCGSWECGCKTPHSIPYKVTGKCGSTKITLLPAPKGKGLCVEQECAKILKLAGIKDVWSKSSGQTRVKTNLIAACAKALQMLSTTKIRPEDAERTGTIAGQIA